MSLISVPNLAQPLVGVGILVALLLVFRPLLTGLLRAALLVIKPRQSLEERQSRRVMKSVFMLNRMAKDFDATQPSQAAELRWLASRG
jgi:hypothetical protein